MLRYIGKFVKECEKFDKPPKFRPELRRDIVQNGGQRIIKREIRRGGGREEKKRRKEERERTGRNRAV